MTTHDPIPARLAALKTATTPELKAQWRDLFDSEPPPFNRRYLESRLAYRIQELAYGGLKPETVRRLERLGEELDGGDRRRAGPRRHHAHRRHAAAPRMAGRRARRHRHRRRLRLAGAALQVAVGHRPRHHRHALERLGVLRPEEPEEPVMARSEAETRCAVYTRKSSEEGLEQEFNSLHAQREACEAYIASQRSEGWVLVRDQYDDGGISGGTLDRPGLQRLLEDIEDGLVDVVVVYKIDRLSRSLADFAKLVEVFDRNGVTFVSVTQSFNTTTSMGRLTLNILLSFAQFEREVTAERIRDKVAASRKKGMWMGGVPPYGYRVENRKLVIDDEAADACPLDLRPLPRDRLGHGTGAGGWQARHPHAARQPDRQEVPLPDAEQPRLHRRGGPQGRELSRRARRHHRPRDVGPRPRHPAGEPPQARRPHPRRDARAAEGAAVRSRWRRVLADPHPQGRRLYRYYVSQTVLKHGAGSCPVGRVPAGEIEAAVIDQLRAVFRQPEIVAGTWKAARAHADDITEADARAALQQLDPLWDELFPAEQARIVALLVERVDIGTDGSTSASASTASAVSPARCWPVASEAA
jgi:site-specific DNA recombinase